MLTSARSPRVAAVKRLHESRGRRDSRSFLVEGPQSVREALRVPGLVRELYLSSDASDQCHAVLAEAGVEAEVVSPNVLEAMAETRVPQGLLAVCGLVTRTLDDVLGADAQLVIVIDGAGDPGNVGTIIRTADAAGADAVILLDDSVDPHNGKCVRATAGSLFHVPIASGISRDEIVSALRARGIALAVTAADGDCELFDAAGAPALAWVMGSEAHGVSAELSAHADMRVSIPMFGPAESLNVATAAAICLYASASVRHGLVVPVPERP